MDFLKYSNENYCNIIPQEQFEGLIHRVFGIVAENLGRSLGPLGSSAMIIDGMWPEATKDGYAILNNYRFHNRYMKMIYNLIKQPCTKMNNTVGDGTTTAIVLANAIFNRYTERKKDIFSMYHMPRELTQTWDSVVADLITNVKEQATEVDPEDYQTIYNIAYVTSNGNHEISDAIAKTYQDGKSPSIKLKWSPTNKSYITPIKGLDFPANLINDAFIRNQDLSVTESDLHVMILDHKLEMDFYRSVLIPINEVFRAQGKRFLVLASDYDMYMCETVVKQYVDMELRKLGYANMILEHYELGKLHKQQLRDLSVVLRGKIVTQELASTLAESVIKGNVDSIVEDILEDDQFPLYRVIGTAAEASMSCENGSIFRVDDIESDATYNDTLASARNELASIMGQTDHEKQSYASKIYDAKARISQLEMRNFIYYIGADSALQKKILWDSVEDVVKCVRSATRSGIVPGCQIAILRACSMAINKLAIPSEDPEHTGELLVNSKDVLKVEIINMFYEAVKDVYHKVLSGPDGTGIVKMLPRWKHTTEDGHDELQKEAHEKAEDVINASIQANTTFDLETRELNPNLVTSAETDTMVLTAASELVKILISGNQCVFLDSDVNESHNEIVEAYV